MIEFEELLSVGLDWVLLGAWRALPLIGIVLVIDLLLRRRIAARFHCLFSFAVTDPIRWIQRRT